ncbi:SGNH/GDSL hydrolase family protein [Pullulanibacillus sp. KACC 23026]|uniref:SGNH/GDSL hydrolase family protein n=1 Tax=Pullulanibacillus sp. KACC 23026 TaxID=3028315 RepID=UPI0023AFF347|nr:SGNH/GDSL hydrolase family protein [Pullulanibacillus sp. KACC 23026]WEG14828.1 SGNH/GDSL hydrolase family protein [Pullulanibacillus sp. KACC 23026]
MKIICFGDSLTRGVTFVKGRLRIIKENYPAVLQSFFGEAQNEEVLVVNKGVFNDNSDLLLERLEKDVVAERPDAAIIAIGGNDCDFRWEEVAKHPDRDHQAIVPLTNYLENVSTLIFRLKQAGIQPMMTTMPPLDPVRYYRTISERTSTAISHWISKVGGIEHWHGNYNRQLTKLLEELAIPKIDVRSAIKQAGDLSELLSDDGIHLTKQGYNVFSKAVYEKLNQVFSRV